MNDQDEIYEAGTETPANLAPANLPGGFDGVQPDEKKHGNLEFYGYRFVRFGGPKLGTKLIAKRVNQPWCGNPVQVIEIDVRRATAISGCVATATENGELLFTLAFQGSFARCEKMAISAMNRFLFERYRTGRKRHNAKVRKADGKENG